MIEPLKPLAHRENEGRRAKWRRGKCVATERKKKKKKNSWKAKIGKVPISPAEMCDERPDDNATTHKRRLSEPLPLIPKAF